MKVIGSRARLQEQKVAIPSWVGAMSTSQKAVMPYGWGVRQVRVWVAGKTV